MFPARGRNGGSSPDLNRSLSVFGSYLDGVPIKLNEKILPHRPLGPMVNRYNFSQAELLLNETYDFTLERRVLNFLEQSRRNDQACEDARTDRELEEFVRGPLNNPVNHVNEASGGSTVFILPQSQPQPRSYEKKGILVPESFSAASSSQQSRPTSTVDPAILRDLDEDDDPFEKVVRESLNEVEELKMLDLGTNQSNPSNNSSENPHSVPPPRVNGYVSSGSVRLPPIQDTDVPKTTIPDRPHSFNAAKFSRSAATSSQAELTRVVNVSYPPLVNTRQNGFATSALSADKGPPLQGRSEPSSLKQYKSPGRVSKLPDLYSNLDDGQRAFADAISNMGFDKPRVTRAVLQFGIDDKKVVDFLCQVNKLTEQEHDPDVCEKALLENGCDIEKAKKFLESYKQLADMGFDENDIFLALKSNGNNVEEALKFLIKS